MPLHSIVLAKQVPDTTDITPRAMKADGTLNRSALPAVLNQDDLHALEMALAVKDEHGGTVTIITMGPSAAADILREALYRGADRAILLTDRRFAAADTLATSYTLSAAVNKIKTFDLIFCGREASDGNTAQVGPQVAEKLGIPQITCVDQICSLDGGRLEARRLSDEGCERVRDIVQNLNLEWLHRLTHDPRRTYRRYAVGSVRLVRHAQAARRRARGSTRG